LLKKHTDIFKLLGLNEVKKLKNKHKKADKIYRLFVRKKGLEPPRLAAPDPKSGAATNYATSALGFCVGKDRVKM
jgi:hypothetical protein